MRTTLTSSGIGSGRSVAAGNSPAASPSGSTRISRVFVPRRAELGQVREHVLFGRLEKGDDLRVVAVLLLEARDRAVDDASRGRCVELAQGLAALALERPRLALRLGHRRLERL